MLEAGADICDYPLARVAFEVVLAYLIEGEERSYTVTLDDLRIHP